MPTSVSPRVVLTGGTGFIGRHMQRALLRAGYSVTVIVRPGSRNAKAVEPACERFEASLGDETAIRKALLNAACGIYCAGTVRGVVEADFRAANVDGVDIFARAALASMPKPRVLLLSSLAASRPGLSAYAATKRLGEQRLRNHGTVQQVILRPPAVYGPGDTEMRPVFRAIRAGVAAVIGPRGQRISLLYVDDLAQAILAVLQRFDVSAGHVFELDDGRPGGYGWPELIAMAAGSVPVVRVRVAPTVLRCVARSNAALARLLGYAPMLTPGKVRELCEPEWLCNNQPLTNATGWTPSVGLVRGLAQTFR